MLFVVKTSDRVRPRDDAPPDDAAPVPLLDDLAAEAAADARRMRWTLLGAALFHAALLLVVFPDLSLRPREVPQREKRVYVVRQMRFQPPTARPRQAQPKPAAKKIPIPDPTPDDPEPIVVDELPVPQLDVLPGLDVVFGIPEAPPQGFGGLDGYGALEVGGDVRGPVRIYGPDPRYTEEARKSRIQGMVILRAVIDEEGDVVAAQVVKGLPLGLTESALDTIRTWKYQPAMQGNRPVPVYLNLLINFRLM